MKKLFLLLYVLQHGAQLFPVYTAEFANKTKNFVQLKVWQEKWQHEAQHFTLWPQGTIIEKDFSLQKLDINSNASNATLTF